MSCPDLQGLPGVVRTQTAGLSGGWTEFERNDLGTPTAELLDGVHQWEAFPYAGGPAIGEVRSPRLGVPQLTPVHWDSEGRLEELGEQTYAWSDDGMMLSASENGVVREERVYDAFGRAVLVKRDGKTLERVHAGKSVVRERSSCGERVWWMSSGLDEPVGYTLHWEPACDEGVIGAAAMTAELELFDVSYASYQDSKPDMLGASGATFGLVQDLHNDVVGVLDAAKNLVESYEYDIYGARTRRDAAGVLGCFTLLGEPCVSGVGNMLGYTGRSLSRVTGFYDMRARMYSPALRVFASRDPLGFVDSYDLWAYTSGDPLNFWDPFGLAEVERGEGSIRPEQRANLDRAKELMSLSSIGRETLDNIEKFELELVFVEDLRQRASFFPPDVIAIRSTAGPVALVGLLAHEVEHRVQYEDGGHYLPDNITVIALINNYEELREAYITIRMIDEASADIRAIEVYYEISAHPEAESLAHDYLYNEDKSMVEFGIPAYPIYMRHRQDSGVKAGRQAVYEAYLNPESIRDRALKNPVENWRKTYASQFDTWADRILVGVQTD